jgi:cell wall-associated NlpC family hydrolase
MEGISVKDLEPGDLVFFTTYAPGASHVGIYLACSKFIHASSSGQVKISSLDDEFYRSVFIGGRRYFR